MKLSVIIPSYNRHDLAKIHVRECMNSERVPDEIIVVNDGGPEDLRDKLKELNLKTKVIYARIREDITWNYNGACNLGFWLSGGDAISLEDVDHIPLRTTYGTALSALENDPALMRVCYARQWVWLEEALSKPFDEWKPWGKLGPNQMVTTIRRDMYIKLKGQDERFCGRYGWMAYDWASRYRRLTGFKSTRIGNFYIIKEGSEPNMKRGMSPENLKYYRENARSPHIHSSHGILNFTYDYEVL